MVWFLSFLTEHSKIPYESIMQMPINLMLDYYKQMNNLFVTHEREKIDVTNINKFRMTDEDIKMLERGEIK